MAEITKPLIDPDKIVKEVFADRVIQTRSELNVMQVKAINIMWTISTIMGNDLIKSHVIEFMRLQLSKERKSRGEFVESLKTKRDELLKKAKSFAMFG